MSQVRLLALIALACLTLFSGDGTAGPEGVTVAAAPAAASPSSGNAPVPDPACAMIPEPSQARAEPGLEFSSTSAPVFQDVPRDDGIAPAKTDDREPPAHRSDTTSSSPSRAPFGPPWPASALLEPSVGSHLFRVA